MFKLKSWSIISLKFFFYIFLYQKRNKKNKQNKGFEKKARERYQNHSKEEKTKSEYMVVNDIEISLKKK